MNTRARSTAVLLASLVALCLALGAGLLRARQRALTLKASHEMPKVGVPPAQAQPADAHTAPTPGAADLQGELEARTALLAEARQLPEVARREAVLRVILRLKEAHTRTPPPAPVLPLPYPKDAPCFAELLDDPEYLGFQLEHWRRFSGDYSLKRMERLGIPEHLRNALLDLEFDRYAASVELQRFSRGQPAERDAARQTHAATAEEIAGKISALLGDDLYARYNSREGHMFIDPAAEFSQLTRRLSYSDEPLSAAQLDALAVLSHSTGLPEGRDGFAVRAHTMKAGMRSILSQRQWAAVEALQAEQDASQARRKLPKSSELPRTTRRARLEGEGPAP